MHRIHMPLGLTGFVKKNTVMLVALVAAVVTCFIIPPDEAYLDYFDFNTRTIFLASM